MFLFIYYYIYLYICLLLYYILLYIYIYILLYLYIIIIYIVMCPKNGTIFMFGVPEMGLLFFCTGICLYGQWHFWLKVPLVGYLAEILQRVVFIF